jgi:hypothetical protein
MVKVLAAVLVCSSLTVPAVAAAPLTIKHARKVARDVRHQDALDAYDVDVDMGGPVTFGALSCARQTPRYVLCGYSVTRTDGGGKPGRLRCRVNVHVRMRAGRTSWQRNYGACGRV